MYTTTVECPSCLGTAVVEDDTAVYICNECSERTQLTVTDHAYADRWVEFTDQPHSRLQVKESWDRATTVHEDPRDWDAHNPEDVGIAKRVGHRFDCDETRYDPESLCVLLRTGTSIVTIIDAPDSRLNCKLSILQTVLDDSDDDGSVLRSTASDLLCEHEELDCIALTIEREKLRRALKQRMEESE